MFLAVALIATIIIIIVVIINIFIIIMSIIIAKLECSSGSGSGVCEFVWPVQPFIFHHLHAHVLVKSSYCTIRHELMLAIEKQLS
jgi:hypothetical protein